MLLLQSLLERAPIMGTKHNERATSFQGLIRPAQPFRHQFLANQRIARLEWRILTINGLDKIGTQNTIEQLPA